MSNKMGVVCYTEEGESIEVPVEASAVTGTYLVRNLRKAVKEERKHHYANVDADQIPIALRGSTEPLKGGDALVDGKEYQLLLPTTVSAKDQPSLLPFSPVV